MQQAAKFEQLALRARAEGLVLRGYSDGAMSEDRRIGAYAWLVAVQSKEGELEILAGGGGGADANDKENVLLSSTRMEALGLAAGMSYARAWTGRVEWRVDNLGVVKGFRKLRHMTPADWGRVSDRDVAGGARSGARATGRRTSVRQQLRQKATAAWPAGSPSGSWRLKGYRMPPLGRPEPLGTGCDA